MNKAMRLMFIVMILKKEGARDMGEFKPISLVSSLYKIISKVLSVQLHAVMGMVMSSTQSASIRRRQIMDSILIANECELEKKIERERGVV